ncbi:hypothetical protein DSO57_1039679 [Entomophthora muscae]|uniref:Uncharacterized protein n=1 Tax=Entomophthora muscae TaxID=34485 RepID=A0ACC2SPY9_9FUNG|nr:hypothetical protein DSO57_1039679 [Entomophthora muscae]
MRQTSGCYNMVTHLPLTRNRQYLLTASWPGAHSSAMVHLIGDHFTTARSKGLVFHEEMPSTLSETDFEGKAKLMFHSDIDFSTYMDTVLTDMRVACLYNGYIYFMFNIRTKVGDELRVLLKASRETGDFSNYTTKGSPPLYQQGLSVAQKENIVYVATGNSIHALNLTTAYWTHYSIPGFVAAKSGCLYLQGSTLIHAFGAINQEFNLKTQFIDTNKWQLTNTYSPPHVPSTNYIPYSIGVLVILNIILVSALVYKLLKRKRPPKMLTKNIWSDPDFTYSIDMSLSTPSLFDPQSETCVNQSASQTH